MAVTVCREIDPAPVHCNAKAARALHRTASDTTAVCAVPPSFNQSVRSKLVAPRCNNIGHNAITGWSGLNRELFKGDGQGIAKGMVLPNSRR
jgi:hypothetical protein